PVRGNTHPRQIIPCWKWSDAGGYFGELRLGNVARWPRRGASRRACGLSREIALTAGLSARKITLREWNELICCEPADHTSRQCRDCPAWLLSKHRSIVARMERSDIRDCRATGRGCPAFR